MSTFEPFDPTDPVDVAADAVRRDIADIGLKILEDPSFTALEPQDQITAIIGGGMTGIIGVVFSMVENDASVRDLLANYIQNVVPQAAAHAAAILDDGGVDAIH